MDDGWTLPRSRRSSAGGLPTYNSVVTSQPTSTRGEGFDRGEVIRMQSFSAVSSVSMPPPAPFAPSSVGDSSRVPSPAPPAPSSVGDSSGVPPPAPPAPSSVGDSSLMPPPAPLRASTKVSQSGQGVRVSSSVADYALPLPTLAMRSEKPAGAMSIAAELALARKSSLRGSRGSLIAR